ncbi:MAG: hypothetical protein R3B06_27970 [Kofleriaceae bacterium]
MTEPAPLQPAAHRCPRCKSERTHRKVVTTHLVHAGVEQVKDSYDRVKSYEFSCDDCHLAESMLDSEAGVMDLRLRWTNPEARPYTHEEFKHDTDYIISKRDEFDRKRTWPRDPHQPLEFYIEERQRDLVEVGRRYLPENPDLREQILANPEDNTLRRAYAAWIRVQPPATMIRITGNRAPYTSTVAPADAAWFINAQLDVNEAWRANPKADVAPQMRDGDHQWGFFDLRGGYMRGWGRDEFFGLTYFLENLMFVRGFVEHVAIKAHLFPSFAPFLYTLAPFRHLTLTYVPAVLDKLLASPHLARIRSLKLPNRMENNHYTRLNDLTDEHVRAVAACPHLAPLHFLDLEDNTDLTPRAFDHLALSPYLRSLSHVRLDIYSYSRSFGGYGDHSSSLAERRLERWRDELEARHGYLPWLHPEDDYGTAEPLLETVDAHPVGEAAFRPDIAARCRARLPVEVDLALTGLLTPDASLRAVHLDVEFAGGRLVATLNHATPDPALPDLRALVTLTVRRINAPARAYDFATATNLDLHPGTTVTVGVRLPPPHA